MSMHNYTNPAFCQSSEFYHVPSASVARTVENRDAQQNVDTIYNRSCNARLTTTPLVHGGSGRRCVVNVEMLSNDRTSACREGPLGIQRSFSTRSFIAHTAAAPTITAMVSSRRPQLSNRKQQQELNTTLPERLNGESQASTRSGRYALVPVEELLDTGNRYAIVPGPLSAADGGIGRRFAKSQDNLERYDAQDEFLLQNTAESLEAYPGGGVSSHSATEPFASLPITFDERSQRQLSFGPALPKIRHAFSSDFGSKSFLLVDKNSNQRYQMVPTAEDEDLVDDNQEIIQMHNGRAHRYAVIPTDDDPESDDDEMSNHAMPARNQGGVQIEQETCLSQRSDLDRSQFDLMGGNLVNSRPAILRTSTPRKGVSMGNLSTTASYPNTPLKNPTATRMLHELLSTPRKAPVSGNSVILTPAISADRRQQYQQEMYGASIRTPANQRKEVTRQRLQYETMSGHMPHSHSAVVDRTTAVITPRVAVGARVSPQLREVDEEDLSSGHEKTANNTTFPQKIANANITLAIISLMLVLGSTMNSGLIIYMIAHFGKSFYLEFSLISAFCGAGLGFLGFKSRKCEWLPNRSYTSGYILVTLFCLLKCCGLLVILVLDPYPGLPMHDVTTGVILGLSTFSMFFIGLGVIGSRWCYRPPPDNRVDVV